MDHQLLEQHKEIETKLDEIYNLHVINGDRLNSIEQGIQSIHDNKIKIIKIQEEVLKLKGTLKIATNERDAYKDAYSSQVAGFIDFLNFLIGIELTDRVVQKYDYKRRWDQDPEFMPWLMERVKERWQEKTQD